MGVGIMGKIFCLRNGNFIPVGVMGVSVMGHHRLGELMYLIQG